MDIFASLVKIILCSLSWPKRTLMLKQKNCINSFTFLAPNFLVLLLWLYHSVSFSEGWLAIHSWWALVGSTKYLFSCFPLLTIAPLQRPVAMWLSFGQWAVSVSFTWHFQECCLKGANPLEEDSFVFLTSWLGTGVPAASYIMKCPKGWKPSPEWWNKKMGTGSLMPGKSPYPF